MTWPSPAPVKDLRGRIQGAAHTISRIECSIQKLLNKHRTHSVDKNCSVEAVEAVEARDNCSVEAVQARDG